MWTWMWEPMALRRGAVRCGAVRCGAVRLGLTGRPAVRDGVHAGTRAVRGAQKFQPSALKKVQTAEKANVQLSDRGAMQRCCMGGGVRDDAGCGMRHAACGMRHAACGGVRDDAGCGMRVPAHLDASLAAVAAARACVRRESADRAGAL